MNSLLEQLGVLADPTRCRLLFVLEREELTVGELCQVLELPQSTVSRHLKQLVDSSWLDSRRDGNRRFYAVNLEPIGPSERRLWTLVRNDLESTASEVAADLKRLGQVLDQRRRASTQFFSSAAERWDALRSELLSERAELLGLLGLLNPAWTVGDLGCGTGAVSLALAPFVTHITAVDASQEMLEVARDRTEQIGNIELLSGRLEALPLESSSLDAAVLCLVLPYAASPIDVLREARRVLRPGSPLVIVDLEAHSDDALRERMGHQRLGFESEALVALAERAGFQPGRSVPIQNASERPGSPCLFSFTVRVPTAVGVQVPDETASRIESKV